MANFLTAVLRWFLGVFARLFAFGAAHLGATKIVLATLFIIILPIIINNVIYDLMETVFTSASSFAAENPSNLETTVNFTGLAAYMLDALGLIDSFSVILSCMAIRFAMSWIPFVGPK